MRTRGSGNRGLIFATVLGPIAAVVIGILLGESGTITIAPPEDDTVSTETSTTTVTVTAPEPIPPLSAAETEPLAALQDMTSPTVLSSDGYWGQARLRGSVKVFNDSLALYVFPDSAPDDAARLVRVTLPREFDRVRGTVGISTEARCPENSARLHLKDQTNQTFWHGTATSSPTPVTAEIAGATELQLQQESLGSTADKCQGEAVPVWAGFKLVAD